MRRSIKWRYRYTYSPIVFKKTTAQIILRRLLLKKVFARAKREYKYTLQVVKYGSTEGMQEAVVSGLRHYSVLQARVRIVEDWIFGALTVLTFMIGLPVFVLYSIYLSNHENVK